MPDSERIIKRRFDYKQVETFGKVNLPVEKMAIILNASTERIQNLMDRKNSLFCKSYERGQALAYFSIARKQFAVAVGEETGNTSMLTYLGSLYLGQDKKKRVAEKKQEAAEKLIENVSEEQRLEMFNALIGTSSKKEDIINDGDG